MSWDQVYCCTSRKFAMRIPISHAQWELESFSLVEFHMRTNMGIDIEIHWGIFMGTHMGIPTEFLWDWVGNGKFSSHGNSGY